MEKEGGMKKTACLIGLLAALSLVRASQTIENRDGVRAVHNGKDGAWGSSPKVELKLLRKIGDVDTSDENFAFANPGDIVEDRSGNIYIADAGQYRIQKFDRDGKFLASFGRKGQGPGEFSTLRSLSIDSAERLHVLDDSQRRIQIFRTDGTVTETLRLLRGTMDYLRCLDKGSYLVHEQIPGPRPVEQKTLLKILDSKETHLADFCTARDFGEPVTNQVGNAAFRAVGLDGSILVAFVYQNRIEKYSPDGKLVWTADRPLNYETKVLEKGKYEATATMSRYTGPKMNMCSRGIAADNAGRIWVVTCRRQIKPEEVIKISQSGSAAGVSIKREGNTDLRTTDIYELEIFDRDGVLLSRLPLTHFVDGIWIFGNRLYLLDRERGVTYYQYEIREK
jgi:hypothetical protein